MAESLDFGQVSTVLEGGCGAGQFTVPFVERVKEMKENFTLIALDVSSGPYEGDLTVLKRRIRKEGLKKFIVPVKGDVRKMAIGSESIDVIVSNELFCDLDRKGLERALQEFYRVLRSDGQMIHGELDPRAENEAQRLLIEANAFSLETVKPEPKWFSPSSYEVVMLMRRTGFKNPVVKYFETKVRMRYSLAIEKLKEWKINPTFVERRWKELERYGLEFPKEHVIFCHK
jgi:ubiquinone/menaquinone biosynthesis C-methylase UbiE